jgi:hypothetical protein
VLLGLAGLLGSDHVGRIADRLDLHGRIADSHLTWTLTCVRLPGISGLGIGLELGHLHALRLSVGIAGALNRSSAATGRLDLLHTVPSTALLLLLLGILLLVLLGELRSAAKLLLRHLAALLFFLLLAATTARHLLALLSTRATILRSVFVARHLEFTQHAVLGTLFGRMFGSVEYDGVGKNSLLARARCLRTLCRRRRWRRPCRLNGFPRRRPIYRPEGIACTLCGRGTARGEEDKEEGRSASDQAWNHGI